MEEDFSRNRWNETLLFAELRRGVADEIPASFVSHMNLTVDEMMNYVLRGELPKMRIISFKEQMDDIIRSPSFIAKSMGEREEFLEDNYPEFKNWFESVLAGADVWNSSVKREYENPRFKESRRAISQYLTDHQHVERIPEIAQEIMDQFKVRKYKMRTTIRGSIDNLFDSINVTDKCRQVVLVKPLEDKVMYKLSNRFGDKVTKAHAQRSLVDIPSHKNKLNNYIGMTFNKNKTSKKVVTVFIEERLPKTSFDSPTLEIVFENLEDADGEVVLNYFLQSISDITPRGKTLKSILEASRFDVFDVEMITGAYNKKYMRHSLIKLSTVPELRTVLFSESSYRIDEQRFCLRSLSGKVRARVDFMEKGIVFSSPQDIFDVLDFISLVLAHSLKEPMINLFEPLEKWERKAETLEESKYTLDVIEIKDGERVLKKAVFFESVYSKVCNKPETVPLYGEGVDATDQETVAGFFPPEKLIKQLEASGQYSFPRYLSQRFPIQITYGSGLKGKKADTKIRVLGRRTIPRERRDELSASDNLSYIFGYFPCVITMKESEYKRNQKEILEQTYDVLTTEEEGGSSSYGDYIYDETKDEIPLGRRARTQMYFFDPLKTKVTNEILRMGVEEGPASLFSAVSKASGKATDSNYSIDKFYSELSSQRILQAGIAQFPDSKPDEIKRKLEVSLSGFIDSKYFSNMIGEFLDVNVIVFEYSEPGTSLEYAHYECPNGIIPPNIFEQLNENRRTVILLRRRYQHIPDQYDVLIESDPIQNSETTSFPTDLAKRFLEKKVTFVDFSPEVMDGGKTVRVKSLSTEYFKLIKNTGLTEALQIIDSAGSRIGTIFSTETHAYPMIHAYRLSPSVGLKTATFREFLELPRPSLVTILEDLKIVEFSGVGYTRTNLETFVTSVMFHDLILLCQPTLLDNDLKMLFNSAREIETPDPYISNQFSVKGEFQTILMKRKFIDIVTLFLLHVLFIEALERFVVKNSFETRTYREWRKNIFLRERSSATDPETVSITSLLSMIGEIKGLMGEVPSSPIQSLSKLAEWKAFFTPSGSLRCFSDEMINRLDFQLSLYEKIIPTLGIQVRVPRLVYRVQGVYESTATLSQSPESFTGVGNMMINDYRFWQEECKTSIENSNIYETINKTFFTVSREKPVIGFYGKQNSGLWAIQSSPRGAGSRYPVINNTLPNIIYASEREFDIFLPENPEDTIHMKRII
jgi:hypothetical protein